MHIQWYPGHMHKAGKEIKALLPDIDIIIEILDARIPFSSENPMLADIGGGKPRIKVLNKCDLADPIMTAHWQASFERVKDVKTLAVTMSEPQHIQKIKTLCHSLLPAKSRSGSLIHALIMGIPNVGKSTIINILAGRTVAKTGNEPAVTKTQQRINIGNNVILFDTPGMLWPNVENKNSGFRLAATGAIKDTAIQHESIALFLSGYLLSNYADCLKKRFQFQTLPGNSEALLDAVGKKRGCLRAGGQIDRDKAAKILLTELRSGTLGKITLETPEIMTQELAELAIIREQKAARKKARKQKWRESD